MGYNPGAESLWVRRMIAGGRMTAGAPKSPNNDTSNFFNRVNMLLKDLRIEHGGAKLACCLECRLISLPPGATTWLYRSTIQCSMTS